MGLTTKIIIFLAGVAVLSAIGAAIIPAAEYITMISGVSILIVLGYKLYVVLFGKK